MAKKYRFISCVGWLEIISSIPLFFTILPLLTDLFAVTHPRSGSSGFVGLGLLMSIFALPMAIYLLLTGIFLLKRKPMGRIMILISCYLGILYRVSSILSNRTQPSPQFPTLDIFSNFPHYSLIWLIFLIYYFNRPLIKGQFFRKQDGEKVLPLSSSPPDETKNISRKRPIILGILLFVTIIFSAVTVFQRQMTEPRGEKMREKIIDNLMDFLIKHSPKPQDGIQRVYFKYSPHRNQIHYEYTLKNGERNGPYKVYNEKGTLISEFHFKDDHQNGLQRYYYETGELESEINYVDWRGEGPSRYFYKNGNIKSEVNMKNGKKDGVYREYDENGNQIKEVFYANGEPEK